MNVEHNQVQVWDPFVRWFHWSLLTAYVVAWVSAEEWDWLHEQTGYFILALVGLRVLWGLVGSRHARFRDFIRGPGQVRAYLLSLMTGRPQHYRGHNPAGGWMVLALLLTLVLTGLSGIAVGGDGAALWEDLHEGLAGLTLLLVSVHIAGVVLASLVHGENLIRAMWTGRKQGRMAGV